MPGFRSKSQGRYGKRHIPGEMNATERAYADILNARVIAGEVQSWTFESHTFKLADNTRYTPDFEVFLADGTLEFVDTKGAGPVDPKSIVKIKVAADRFFWYGFVIEQRQAKKNGGGWKRTDYSVPGAAA